MILYRRVENQWGDGMRGLRYQRARTSLEELEKLKDGPHIKNWRPQALIVSSLLSSSSSSSSSFFFPQVLLLCKMHGDDFELSDQHSLRLLEQLKGGRGLCILGSIIEVEA